MVQQALQWEPKYLNDALHLVEEHRRLEGEPLLLAVYYSPDRDPDDLFLLEVIENFGSNSIDADRELFEVSYEPPVNSALRPGQHLRLVLTNPEEFRLALVQGWPLAEELRSALRTGKARVVWSDPSRPELEELLRA